MKTNKGAEQYLKKIGFNKWIVIKDIYVTIPRLKETLKIEKGFVCNLYSGVPNLDPLAAVVHDYLYRFKNINGVAISKQMADRIFLDLMRHAGGVTKFFSGIYYVGVVVLGVFCW